MIKLPRTNKEGKPRVSYSQIRLFNEAKTFRMQTEGVLEYIAVYFFGVTSSDVGWGQFGKDVEAYIAERKKGDFFTDDEKRVLEEVEVLGVTSDDFELDFGDFVLSGIIDDRLEDWSKIRDYKTASKNSKKQYEKSTYKQLDLYALKGLEATGKIPRLEVCVIERKGNAAYGGGREALKVGSNIWYIEKKTNEKKLRELKTKIRETVLEISEYYKIFLKYNT